jgi:microcystin-dependent protein
MATITGFTAARMKEIEDASIVDGNVVGDDLILDRFDGTTINAGNVRGTQGIQGVPGEVSTAQLNAAIAGVEDSIVASMPVGSITMFAGAVAPTNWMFAEGQAISRTTYSGLFALIASTYGDGNGTTTFDIPDFRGRFPVARNNESWNIALDDKGGNSTQLVPSHLHPVSHNHAAVTTSSDSHSHTATHNHTASSAAGGVHAHYYAVRKNMTAGGDLGEAMISNSTGTGDIKVTQNSVSHTHGVTVNSASVVTATDAHTHSVDLPDHSGDTGSAGLSPELLNLPPYITINFIIKVL